MTTNQPELKACPPNQELFDLIAEQTGKVLLQSELNDIINLVLKLNSHSPIIPEDAVQGVTDDELREAIRLLNRWPMVPWFKGRTVLQRAIQTLVNHAIKGQSK